MRIEKRRHFQLEMVCGNSLLYAFLCNAPATFEHLIEQVLQKLLSKICLVYLDDAIIFSKTFEEIIPRI